MNQIKFIMQNYKNHLRLYPLHHFLLVPITTVIFIWTCMNVLQNENTIGEKVLSMLIAVAILLVSWIARGYAIKNQDRNIRIEESLRYFVKTGKSFSENEAKLRLSQIIALRFASDEEWLPLMEKAIAENLSPKDIKLAIVNWRADNRRV